jgi:hypothetical protein
VGKGYVAIHRPTPPLNMTHHPQFENGTPFRSSTFYPFKELLFHDYFLQVVRVRERERERERERLLYTIST